MKLLTFQVVASDCLLLTNTFLSYTSNVVDENPYCVWKSWQISPVFVSFPQHKPTGILNEPDSWGKIKKLIWSSSQRKYDNPGVILSTGRGEIKNSGSNLPHN